jgi:phosphatidylglycerophosphate synthase|tara:strand:- start:135 stop:998 length:864 start_codon:yes stop_codon:yes gene_type:complete
MNDADLSVNELIEPVNRYFHNSIAAQIVNILKNTWVTPDQVTYISIFIGLISAYIFSLGTPWSFFLAGILLELVLILDCVDGQLARVKKCASDWGRLLDGIAGYIIYLAVLGGIMIGLDKYYIALILFGVVTILRGIAYDYCKLTFITIIQKGYDGSDKEILDTYLKISKKNSILLKLYFYYLQVQRFIFNGYFNSLDSFSTIVNDGLDNGLILSFEKRKEYREKVSSLMVTWSWNGVDSAMFLLVLISVFGVIEDYLLPLAIFIASQFIFTMIFHRVKIYKINKIK